MDQSQYAEQLQLSKTNINHCNDDILMCIFENLNFDDRIRLMRVCKRWYSLLTYQLQSTKCLKIGYFLDNSTTTSATLPSRSVANLFNRSLLQFPADLQTQCFYVTRYDYLHRSLKTCSQTLTKLSLGHIIFDYRCFVSLVFNCPNIEQLELISCATDPDSDNQLTNVTQDNHIYETDRSDELRQHSIEDIIRRNQIIKNCSIVKDGKRWSRLKYLLIKHCDNLSEPMISLLLTITENSLEHLSIQSNQYSTGECLKYCSNSLKILDLKFCPSLQQRPLEDLIKLKYLTSGKNNHFKHSPIIQDNINDDIKPRREFNELISLSVEYCQLIKMGQLINCITQYCPSIVSLNLDPVADENSMRQLATLNQLKKLKLNANKQYSASFLSDRCNSSSQQYQQSTANRRQIAGS